VFGPAVEKDVSLDEPTYFVVDCSDAGPGTCMPILCLTTEMLNLTRPTNQRPMSNCILYVKIRYDSRV